MTTQRGIRSSLPSATTRSSRPVDDMAMLAMPHPMDLPTRYRAQGGSMVERTVMSGDSDELMPARPRTSLDYLHIWAQRGPTPWNDQPLHDKLAATWAYAESVYGCCTCAPGSEDHARRVEAQFDWMFALMAKVACEHFSVSADCAEIPDGRTCNA